jgi:hypothetical protein
LLRDKSLVKKKKVLLSDRNLTKKKYMSCSRLEVELGARKVVTSDKDLVKKEDLAKKI